MVVSSPQIQHVFVLMLENRSFDHMLGFSGITGKDAVTGEERTVPPPTLANSWGGRSYAPAAPGINPMPQDPGHEFPDTVEELCGFGVSYPPGGPYPPINNSGFVANYVSQPAGPGPAKPLPSDPLQCLTPAQVPVINELAKSFTLCDGWFSSMPGPTWPNRFFVHAASSSGLDHSPTAGDIAKWMAAGFSFQNGTIFDRLEDMGLPWRIYHGDDWPQSLALTNMTRYKLRGRMAGYDRFAADVQTGYEPAYTFIEPSYGAITSTYQCGTSQHPLDDVTRGEWLIKCTYEAIRRSSVWSTSLLIVTYDEHGGFYDHVPPPGGAAPPADQPNSPDNNQSHFMFNQYGPRVPALIISPWIPPNLLDGRLYDHASILSTVEAIFAIPQLTMRDRAARTLLSLATLTAPRTDTPLHLPPPSPAPPLGGCLPLGGCTDLPTPARAHAALMASQPRENGPLTGSEPGFVHVALMQDLSVSSEAERPARIERAAVVTTRDEARRYLIEVGARVRAAEASGSPRG